MRNTSRRTKLIGGALLAAAVAATSIATVSPVSADLGDGGFATPGIGAIRVKPANGITVGTYAEDQNVPVIKAGVTDQAGADVQLLIPSTWEAGDRITLQVQADGTLAPLATPPIHQTNCLDAARTIAFAGTATATVTGGPWAPTTAWSAGDGGGFDPAQNGPGVQDSRLPDANPLNRQTVTPAFTVTMKNDGASCAGQPLINNQIELIFSNSAAPTLTPGVATPANDNVFEITVSNIKYNVGAGVNAGPVHVVPFARWANELTGGTLVPAAGVFGGNDYAAGFAGATFFTNNAFIAPVTIVATGGPLVADGTVQSLGSLTLTELVPDAIDSGVHTITLSNVNLVGTATVAITGNTGATGSATVAGNTITLTLVGMVAGTAGVVTISGLTGFTNTPGPVVATWATSPGLPLAYMGPDDQFNNGATLASDVNIPLLQSVFTTATGVPARIGGNDRYETSAKIAANVDDCTEWVVLVSGTSFPDALSANYLAGALASNLPTAVPVLLVGTDSVPASVSAYISAAGVKNIYIVGGTSAVSAAVQSALQATPATKCTGASATNSTNPVPNQKLFVVRVAGASRYGTNRAAVNLGSDIFEENANMIQLELLQPSKHTAIVATGTAYADALAAGPAVYDGFPLILTDGTSLSPEAALTLTDNDITQVVIVGGTAAVSDAVKAQIAALGIHVERISGANRYATATAFADFLAKGAPVAAVAGAFDGGFNWGTANHVLLASGTNFADALSAGPLAYAWDDPIILTEPTVLSADTQTWLVAHKAALTGVTALGLGSAVSTAVLNAASAAIS